MTDEQKDKLWVDWMVTRLFWCNMAKHEFRCIPIAEFHAEHENFVRHAQETGRDNYQSWNWKHEII